MVSRKFFLSVTALLAIAACGQSANGQASDDQGASSDVSDEDNSDADNTVRNDAVQPVSEAISGEYTTDPGHRYISFSYLHQGLSRPVLRWRNWEGVLNWNAENMEASSVRVTIDVNAIDSGVDEYDDHLRSDDFFDAANHGEITFVSTALSRVSEYAGTMTGDLTIKGTTKPVTLDVKLNKGFLDERNGVYKLGFSAKGMVKRSDFGVDLYVPFVGDEVDIVIEAEFLMAAE